jgi:hypothetical protein
MHTHKPSGSEITPLVKVKDDYRGMTGTRKRGIIPDDDKKATRAEHRPSAED